MKEYLEISYWGEPFIYMLVCFALFLIGKILYQVLHRGIDVDAEMRRPKRVATRYWE